jgi:hypothetical protein
MGFIVNHSAILGKEQEFLDTGRLASLWSIDAAREALV